jgi:phosphopantetheinyl transferase
MSATVCDAIARPADLGAWLHRARGERGATLAVVAEIGALACRSTLDELLEDLDEDERMRCAALRFGDDRRAYAASHALLRAVVGVFVAREPRALRFEIRPSQFGPLRLAPETLRAAPPAVSLSHAGRFAAVAVGEPRTIGIDVEPLRALDELELIPATICAPTELRALESVPREARARAILTIWTAKEAALKALGVGFAIPPHDAVVAFGRDCIPRGVRVIDGRRAYDLSIASFDPAGDGSAVAALAAPRGTAVRCAFGDARTLVQRSARTSSGARSTYAATNSSAAERLRKNAEGSP